MAESDKPPKTIGDLIDHLEMIREELLGLQRSLEKMEGINSLLANVQKKGFGDDGAICRPRERPRDTARSATIVWTYHYCNRAPMSCLALNGSPARDVCPEHHPASVTTTRVAPSRMTVPSCPFLRSSVSRTLLFEPRDLPREMCFDLCSVSSRCVHTTKPNVRVFAVSRIFPSQLIHSLCSVSKVRRRFSHLQVCIAEQ